jgi:hypothetical protein
MTVEQIKLLIRAKMQLSQRMAESDRYNATERKYFQAAASMCEAILTDIEAEEAKDASVR